MKKLQPLLVFMALLASLSSCNKEMTDDSNVALKLAYVESYSTPVSTDGITPVILAVDKPKGGNVSCTDVNQAFNASLLCGVKIDYADEVQFEGAFPEWLNVELNGIYVSFNMTGCVEIDGKNYKVGAVIVKGSNAANVYFYPGGTLSDAGLAAPGNKYMVSNMTFCFVECNPEPLIVAIKSYYWTESKYVGLKDYRAYTVSLGSPLFYVGTWCDHLGVNPLVPSTFPLAFSAGTVIIEEGWPEGVHSWIITVDLNGEMIFDETSLYVGSLSGLAEGTVDSNGCPIQSLWPYHDYTDVNTHVFTIPY